MIIGRYRFYRERQIMALHDAAYQAGVVKGAAEMHRELAGELPFRHHGKVFEAFLRVYDRRKDLMPW